MKTNVRRTLVRNLAAPKAFEVHSPYGPLLELEDPPRPARASLTALPTTTKVRGSTNYALNGLKKN